MKNTHALLAPLRLRLVPITRETPLTNPVLIDFPPNLLFSSPNPPLHPRISSLSTAANP